MEAGPEFPWQLDYLWGWFADLSLGLKSSGMGPAMAGWDDVESYAVAMRIDMELWEKAALVRLSYERAAIQSEKQEAEMKARSKR